MNTTRDRSAGFEWAPGLGRLPFSPIRTMFNAASTMKDVLHLSIGQPDFAAPGHVIEAHIKALRDGHTGYALDAGLPELREAVAGTYNGLYGIGLEPENVLITTGCCQAMFMALTGTVKPGGEVIVIEPVMTLAHIASLAGAKVVRIVTTAAQGYQVDPQEVIDAMNNRTCAIMVNSPGNPTGAVYPASTIEAICDAAAERGICVVSDEVYDRLILDDEPYASALVQGPGLDNVIMSSSVSKSYSLAGFRLGWAISTKEHIETLQRYHMYISTCENTATQWACVAALEGDQSCVGEMVAEYRRRRDRVVELIEPSAEMTGYRPGGAFFVTPSLPAGGDSFDLAMRMLKEIGVCTIPGSTFGESCGNSLRISYSTSLEVIEAAFERMVPWLSEQSF